MLWHIAGKLGYTIREIEMAPIKTYGQDIRELPYLTDLPYTTLNLPTELGVGLRFFSLKGNKNYHPFVLALSKVGRESQEEDVFKLLKKYSDLISIKSPNEMLGSCAGEEFFPKQDHPYSFTYPWSILKPFEVKEKREAYDLTENKRFGLKTGDSLDLAGTSDEKVKIETERLMQIFHRIKTNGFKPQFPDSLGCFVLINGENYKWFVQGGQHRAAVLSALGYEKIPVHVRQIIRREEVVYWPHVLSGLFSQEKALKVFDEMFQTKTPPVAKAWSDYVDKTYYTPTCTSRKTDIFEPHNSQV